MPDVTREEVPESRDFEPETMIGDWNKVKNKMERD